MGEKGGRHIVQQLVCRGQEDGSPPTCSTMAARRISKSAVDWVAFADRIPGSQKDAFRALKQKSDEFMGRVHQNPETMANIDFAFYRQRLANPALVDEMEKGFKALSIPYPTDPDNIKQVVDKREQAASVAMKTDVAKLQAYIAECEDVVKTLDAMAPLDQITTETYMEYFPDAHENLQESFFPHVSDCQPDPAMEHINNQSTNWQDFKSWAYKFRKYIPGLPAEAKWKPDPEGDKKRAYYDQLDSGH